MKEKAQSLCGNAEFESYESCVAAGATSIFERLITCRVHIRLQGCAVDLQEAAEAAIGGSDDVLERGHDGEGRRQHQELGQPCDAHAGSRAVESGVGTTGWHSVRDGRKEAF
jgi:hypothetical protein